MTRVIAGQARGRPLRVPASARPTSDRAREGLFSSLQSLLDLEGARVLDLYAGSGALGLEAVSRGAAEAVLVERDAAAVRVLSGNVAALGLPGVRIVSAEVGAYLAAPEGPGFDLVLLDPPYDQDADPVLALLVPWLAARGVVVVERATRGPAPRWPPGLAAVKSRRYGQATLWYGCRS